MQAIGLAQQILSFQVHSRNVYCNARIGVTKSILDFVNCTLSSSLSKRVIVTRILKIHDPYRQHSQIILDTYLLARDVVS